MIALVSNQQKAIDEIKKQVDNIEQLSKRQVEQNEKNINLVTTSIGEIRHLPKDVERGAQNALRDRMDSYIDNLPNTTFKRLTKAVEGSQRDLLETSIKIDREAENVRKESEEITDKLNQITKKFYGLLIPALIATILNIVSTFYNVTVVQNAITTANNVIANANSTIQQYNSTLNSAIPKIPEVSHTTGIEPWQAIVFSLLVIGSIIFIFIKNNSH